MQTRQQTGQKNDFANIRHANRQRALGGGRYKRCLRIQPGFNQLQGIADGRRHLLGQHGGYHASRRANKQLIAQFAAQFGQRVADSRLGDAQLLSHFGDAPLQHQLLKHHELVEIDIGQIHRTNYCPLTCPLEPLSNRKPAFTLLH